jgi:hypothetical protein
MRWVNGMGNARKSVILANIGKLWGNSWNKLKQIRQNKPGSQEAYSYAEGPSVLANLFRKNVFSLVLLYFTKLCMKYRHLIDINVLEKCNDYAMIHTNSNFGKYRQNLSNLNRNLPKVDILAPGIRIRSSGLNPEGKTIPGLSQVRKCW